MLDLVALPTRFGSSTFFKRTWPSYAFRVRFSRSLPWLEASFFLELNVDFLGFFFRFSRAMFWLFLWLMADISSFRIMFEDSSGCPPLLYVSL